MKKVLFLSVYCCLQCLGKESVISEKNSQITPPTLESKKVVNKFDLAAKRLAGLYIPDEQLNNQVSINYVSSISQEWDGLSKTSLSKIHPWASAHITPMIEDASVVFYPFGGPDIAYVSQFFPKAKEYILVGLEPIGSFANVEKSLSSDSSLPALKKAFSSYLQKGYFITSEMMTQLSNKAIRGCIYLLLLELAKLEFTVNSVVDVSINQEGIEVDRGSGMLDAIKIDCTKPDGTPAKVYYMRADLSSSNTKTSSLKKFMQRSPFTTFLKSASYALHDRSFSEIRSFILNNTLSVLQDDTGIPFYFFDSKWDKCAFGQYTQPTLPVFKAYRQQTLSDFYASHNAASIPFKIGYGFNQGKPNLLLAIPTQRKLIQQMKELKSTGRGCPCKNKEKNT